MTVTHSYESNVDHNTPDTLVPEHIRLSVDIGLLDLSNIQEHAFHAAAETLQECSRRLGKHSPDDAPAATKSDFEKAFRRLTALGARPNGLGKLVRMARGLERLYFNSTI